MTRPTPARADAPLTPARRLLEPLENFLHIEAASGIVLLIAAAAALLLGKLPLGGVVRSNLGTRLSRSAWDPGSARQSLHFWINDGLMTIFFSGRRPRDPQ